MIWHHISTWVCGLARGHMERRRGLAIVFTLRIQLDCKHSWYRWHEFQSWWIVNQEFEAKKETKHGAECGLGRSWLWLWSGSGLDRSGSGSGSAQKWTHMFVYVAAWMQQRKGRQGVQAASVQLGCLAGWPYNLQQCQLDSLTAWMCKSCSLAAGLLSSVTLR